MTLNHYIYEILELANANITDETNRDPRLIKQWINTMRSQWISKKYNTPFSVNPTLTQDLSMELEMVDQDDFFETGANILRTKLEVPQFCTIGRKLAITTVGSIEKMTRRFDLVDSYEDGMYRGSGMFSKNTVFCFPMNNRLYFFSKDDGFNYEMLKWVNVRGVFLDPTELEDFTKKDGTPAYSESDNYPLTGNLWDYIKTQILQTGFNLVMNPKTDAANDGIDRSEAGAR